MIAAIAKAHSLIRHAGHLGVKPTQFAVVLSTAEAYELLDYMAAGGLGFYADHEQLVADVRVAKAQGNPWPILDDCCLIGIGILRQDRLQ